MAILKIIGIILLAVLLLILFFLIVILFPKLRYSIKAGKDEAFAFSARASWLLGIFKIRYVYEGEFSVKVLCFDLSGKAKGGEAGEEIIVGIDEEVSQADAPQKEDSETNAANKSLAKKRHGEKRVKGKPLTDVIASLKESLARLPERGELQALLSCTMRLIVRELKALKPKRFELYGTVGFDDPSVTGKILGLISIVSSASRLPLHVNGDFENELLKFSAEVSGSVSLWSLLLPMVQFVLSKPVWKIISKELFKKRKGEGNERRTEHQY